MAGQPKGRVTVEDARIIFRNFAGREGMYNAEGDRNFAVVLPHEVAAQLKADGWNVKELQAREEGEEPTPYIQVTVSFKTKPPLIKMIGGTSQSSSTLDESTCEVLDFVDIEKVDLVFAPYNWKVGAKTGVKAYLHAIYVTIIEDELALKYNNMEIATVEGPAMNSSEGPLKVRSERAHDRRELES